jgi:hypothetical protein
MADEARKSEREKDPRKAADLPPYGPRNPDPITDSPGSHPIETGIGAAVGGAASGAAVGAVGGPLGAVAGAIVGGAVAGGLAGKGVGELIDPTTEDNWIRDYFQGSHQPSEEDLAAQREAFRYGLQARSRYPNARFHSVEDDLRREWEERDGTQRWPRVFESVRAGFERTMEMPALDANMSCKS